MICPKCNSDSTMVSDGVSNPEDHERYRQRRCKNCNHIFYTMECEIDNNKSFKDVWNKYHRSTLKRKREKKC